jgi:Carboxypeptidase regulatory-like domain/TonB-dependent Receptor Plug Domain
MAANSFTRIHHALCWTSMLCLIAIATITGAQIATVTLIGVVRDPSGGVVPATAVKVTNRDTGIARIATTDTDGRYAVLDLSPGNYEVMVEHAGFARAVREQIFQVGQTVTLDFDLSLASVAQQVDVKENAQTIEVTESQLAYLVHERELDELPTTTRSFSDLAALVPGVQVTPGSTASGAAGSISIGGSESYQTQYLVDSVSNEASGGGQYARFAQDWIQEFSVVTQQGPAEFGNASGGFVNAITRSGSNQIHGRAYGYFQDAALSGTPSFLPSFAPQKPPYSQQRLGGMAGGPIRKDKLFYFVGYEWFHNNTSVPVNVPPAFTSPTATSGVFPQLNYTQLGVLKIEYQASPSHHFVLRTNFEDDSNSNVGIGASGSSVRTFGNATFNTTTLINYGGSWTWIINSKTLNDLRYSDSRSLGETACNYANAVGFYPGTGPNSTPWGNPVGYWAQLSYPTAGVITGCTVFSGAAGNKTSNIYETLSFIRGRHQIKVGTQVGRSSWYNHNLRNNLDGEYTIPGTTPFDADNPATFPVSYFVQYATDLSASPGGWHAGWFAQDTWTIARDLTLNYGLRYDIDFTNEALKDDIRPGFNTINNDYTDVAPRFGFAWTPFGKKNTLIRGGVGRFYDMEHQNLPDVYVIDTTNPLQIYNVSTTRPALNPYCFGTATCSPTVPPLYSTAVSAVLAYALMTDSLPNFDVPGGQLTFGGQTYTVPLPTYVGPGGEILPAPTGSVNNIDQNIKIPHTLQATAGISHEIGPLSLAADFVYIRGGDEIILRNTNITMDGTLVNPAYTAINSFGNGGLLINRSLRFQGSYRTRRGDLMRLAYTLGWSWDNTVSQFGLSSHSQNATDPFDYHVDWGPSALDARNTLVASGIFSTFFGINLSPILSFTSALPYTATTTLSTPGCQVYYNSCYPAGYTKNSLRGDDTTILQARLSKKFHLKSEGKSIMLLFEGFNLLNHPNYGTDYNSSVQSADFQQPIGTVTPPRQLQAGFRFDF